MRHIKSKDISVVVQGAVDKNLTPICLRSIRKHLPGAEIILSTWEGSDVSGLDYDKLILNKDPGAAICSKDGKTYNNCNREIVSTFAGLKGTDRKYVLKIRSDLIIKSNRILKINTQRFKRESAYICFKERVIVCSIYSRYYAKKFNTNTRTPILFHPSDWIYFGLREDIYNLFDIPLTKEPEFSNWFKDKASERYGYTDTHPDRLWRFSPEAYIFTEYLRKNFNINIEDKLDITDFNIELSRHLLLNNFYMADQNQLSLDMPKYNIFQPLMPKVDRDGLYTNYHWQMEYKKFINPKRNVRLTYCEFLNYLVDIFKLKRRSR